MLSIGIYTYSTRPRGSVVHALGLADALHLQGHDVTVYALSKGAEPFFRSTPCRVELLPAAEAPSDAQSLIRQRIAEFVDGVRRSGARHDIHHAEDCLAANALLAVRAELGSPVVRTVHHVERFENPYLLECQRRSIEETDELFSVSDLTRREVRAEFKRDSKRVFNAVDLARFSKPPIEPGALRERFGITAAERIVLSVGGVEPRKNSLRALAALAEIARREPRFCWLLAGGASIWDHAEYRQRFEAALAELPSELRARIRITGVLSEAELTSLYLASDVLLCPSQQEGFGLCVLEALAARTVVVASDAAPFDEYLDADSACLVDPESVADIAAGLARALTDVPLRHRLQRGGLLRARQHSWESSAAQHVQHYQALLARLSVSAGD